MWNTPMMQQYLPAKRIELVTYIATWKNLKNILPTKEDRYKNIYYVILFTQTSRTAKLFSRDRNRDSGCYEGKINWKGCKKIFWVRERPYILIHVMGYMVVYIYQTH